MRDDGDKDALGIGDCIIVDWLDRRSELDVDLTRSYLKAKYNVNWTQLRNIRHPVRVGDVVILPGTFCTCVT